MYTVIALNRAYAHYYWHDYLQKWPMQRAAAIRRSATAGALAD
jgi:hypothetical protein